MLNEILTGFFTGIGVIAGQWVFERYISHRLEKHESKIKNKIIDVKRVFDKEEGNNG